MELADNDPIAKEVRYHRDCYQRYALKCNLEALSVKRKETKSTFDVAFEYISERKFLALSLAIYHGHWLLQMVALAK